MLSDFLSSIFTSSNEEKEEEPPKDEQTEDAAAAAPAEEEEPEPEDLHPSIREACQESAECAKVSHHYAHCQEKVNAGEGAKGETCVEELFHMMHCVEKCAAPKLFNELR